MNLIESQQYKNWLWIMYIRFISSFFSHLQSLAEFIDYHMPFSDIITAFTFQKLSDYCIWFESYFALKTNTHLFETSHNERRFWKTYITLLDKKVPANGLTLLDTVILAHLPMWWWTGACYISMAECRAALLPPDWRYCSLALSHWYMDGTGIWCVRTT